MPQKKQLIRVYILLLFGLIIISCKEQRKSKVKAVEVEITEKDFMKWWSYFSDEIKLNRDFVPLNTALEQIEKKAFLKKLVTGNYIPISIKSEDKIVFYKLKKLSADANPSIRTTIKNQAAIAFNNFKMENKAFPEFNFEDLNGIQYNNENTKGKVLIMKCWFINCKACVEEFGELNNFNDQHKNQNDLVFLSLALDGKNELIPFLKKKAFKYAVIPNQGDFLNNILKVKVYPIHFIIDKNGTIKKVVNDANELIAFFEKGDFTK